MTSMIRWEPVDDLVSLRDAMNRLFEESFVRTRPFFPARFTASPALDIYETSEAIVVEASLPGFQPKDIDITLTGDTLTIKGEVQEESEVEKERYICRERHFGNFTRSVHLPGDLNADEASAEFENGILKLTVPKKEEAKTKTIQVRATTKK